MHLPESFVRELAAFHLPADPGTQPVVTEADLAPLPASVQRYMRFMGVLGRPRDWSFLARFEGSFRRKIDADPLPVVAWQYSTRLDLARIFRMRIRFGHVLPVIGHDTYAHGEGRMLIRVLDLFPIEDSTGPELDIGELVTYLNDAILLAPSMILGPEASFEAVDDGQFDVSLTDHGRTVRARVTLDARGAPTLFRTTDRFFRDPEVPDAPWQRTAWSTPAQGYAMHDGRMLPASGQAVWELATGPLTYADFRFNAEDIRFNVPPPKPARVVAGEAL